MLTAAPHACPQGSREWHSFRKRLPDAQLMQGLQQQGVWMLGSGYAKAAGQEAVFHASNWDAKASC